jgi:hypothetical protein
LEKYVSPEFFRKVFLSLIDYQTREYKTEKVANYRLLINQYKLNYLNDSSYTPIKLVNAQQTAIYESTKICTAYLNNIEQHFGNRLQMFLNLVTEKDNKIKKIEEMNTLEKI